MYRDFDQSSIKWAANVAHVREVTLLGVADLALWEQRLSNQNLRPTERNGRAQLMIIAAEAKFMGVRFRELSFSVQVAAPNDSRSPHGVFLMRAFNTNRLFAFCERMLFSTPYETADVSVNASFPVEIQLRQHGMLNFRAQMDVAGDGRERTPTRTGEDGWEGPVYLPDGGRNSCPAGNLFLARLHGYTKSFEFDTAKDAVTISLSSKCEVLQSLADSNFGGTEWVIREDAMHAKSKTYRRVKDRSVGWERFTGSTGSGAGRDANCDA